MTLSNFKLRSVFAKRAVSSTRVPPLASPHLHQSITLKLSPARGGLQFSFLRSTGLYGARRDQSSRAEAFERERSEVWPRRFAARQWRWAERTAAACLRSPDGSTWTRPDSLRDGGRDEQWDTERARHTCICMCTTVVYGREQYGKGGASGERQQSKVMSPWDKISVPEPTGKCFRFFFFFVSLNVRKWLI